MMQKRTPDFNRYMTALHCGEPDFVPLGDFNVDQLLIDAFLGKKANSLEDRIAFFQTAGFDYVTDIAGFFVEFGHSGGISTQEETVRTAVGVDRTRQWANEHEGAITNWEAFEKYPWPSADDFDYSAWAAFDTMLPPGMKAIPLLGKIYTPVWMLMGAETFFTTLESDPELVAAIFEKVGQIQMDTLMRIIEHPSVGAVANPDDIAHNTGTLVNPKYLKKYLFPWYRKMGEICRQKGLGFVFHSDGDCTEVLDDLIDCGFHGFHPIQPNCMDIAAVKKGWGDRLCLLGNINLDSTLTLGSPEDVRAEVYERIRTIGPGGGYMVASSNSITDYVPLENMKALIDATFEFGQYPIALEEGRIKGKIWTFQGKSAANRTRQPEAATVENYVSALVGSDKDRLIELTRKDMDAGMAASEVVGKRMIPAMTQIGRLFQTGEIYIPEMILAAKTMSQGLDYLKGELAGQSSQNRGTVVIGTVKGDLHDIGKNLVSMMLKGQGYRVEDLGVSVPADRFIAAVQEKKPNILALSALLTTTMVEMKTIIAGLKNAGLRQTVKIIVGGAPLTQSFSDEIGADGYAYDAPGAAEKCNELLS